MTLIPAEVAWLHQSDRTDASHWVYTTPEGNKTHGLYAYQGVEPGPLLRKFMLEDYLRTCYQADAFLIDSPVAFFDHLVQLLRPLGLVDDGRVPACLLRQTSTDNARGEGAWREMNPERGPRSVPKDHRAKPMVLLRIGISISIVPKNKSRVQAEKIYLCICGKILIINNLRSLYNSRDSKGMNLLRWLLTTKQITVHGLHAARIVTHLYYYYDIVSNIRDMTTSNPSGSKIHSIIDLQYHCKQAMKDPVLQALAVPLEVRKLECIFYSMKDLDLVREAFFCALLAQEYPGDGQVMTVWWNDITLKQSIARNRKIGLKHNIALQCQSIGDLVDVINRHTSTDLNAPQCLRYQRLENVRSKRFSDDLTLTPPALWVYTHQKEDLIMPSKKVVLRFDLSYCYWDQDDLKREGKKIPHIKSTMYGQVIRCQEEYQRMLVHFPRGIQAFYGYPDVPIEVVRAGVDKQGRPDVPTYEPFLASDPRLIVEISVYGNRRPSQEDLDIYDHASYLLRA